MSKGWHSLKILTDTFRRAKIKNMARKSIENGEDCESIPESMRRHLAMQAMESGKVWFPGMMGAPSAYGAYNNGTMSLNTDASSGKVGKYLNSHCILVTSCS